jgi:uncharacterized protein YcbX
VPSPAEGLRVSGLSLAPVKGLRIRRPERAVLSEDGLAGDRQLFLVDARGRMLNAKHHGELQQVVAAIDGAPPGPRTLTLGLPDGSTLSEELRLGEQVAVSFFSRPREARVVNGGFAGALSALVGEPVRVVAFSDGRPAVDRGRQGAVTVVSLASVEALAELSFAADLDSRRFRMSVEIAGAEPFAEDGWLGSDVRIGASAVIRPKGNVGRCLVTSRDPDTGEIDVPTLDLLRSLRGSAPTTEPLALGIYAAVVRGGEVAVGDEVSVVARVRGRRY